MRDAPYSTDPAGWEIQPGHAVGDLATVEQCEEAVRFLDMDRDNIMAQIRRHEEGLDERPAGWRSKAQAAMTWKKRIRGAVYKRLADLKKGEKDKPKDCQGWPEKEDGVDETLSPWRSFIGSRPALLSLLYDIDMLPEQCVTAAGAVRLAGLCAVWKRGEEGGLLPPSLMAIPTNLTAEMREAGANEIGSIDYDDPDTDCGEVARQTYLAMIAAAPKQGGEHVG